MTPQSLRQAQIEQVRDQGYAVVPQFVPQAEVAKLDKDLLFKEARSAEFGDRARMDNALDRLSQLGEVRQRLLTQWIARHGRAVQAILDGDFAGAERHAESALALSASSTPARSARARCRRRSMACSVMRSA